MLILFALSMHMVKVISLSNEAYEMLKSRKNHEKSFSDVVMDLADTKRKGSIMDLFGALKDDPDSIKAFEESFKARKKAKLRHIKF